MRCLIPLTIAMLSAATPSGAGDGVPFTHVDYMGERVSLARSYSDPREYKDDPHNLADQQLSQVERLIRNAPFGPTFSSVQALSDALDRLRFPGYGSFYANQLGSRTDAHLEVVYVEVPRRGLNRYITLESVNGVSLRVVDDFVAPDQPEIVRVHRKDGALSYESFRGSVLAPVRQ